MTGLLPALIDGVAAAAGLAVLTEALVQIVKMAAPVSFTKNQDVQLSLVVAICLSLVLVDSVTGVTSQDVVLRVLIGVLASRGSNYLHDLAVVLRSTAFTKQTAANLFQFSISQDDATMSRAKALDKKPPIR
jgi:hypothetical protein